MLREEWTCDVVRALHKYSLTQNDLAAELGTDKYCVSKILNNEGRPALEQTVTRYMDATKRIVDRRKAEIKEAQAAAAERRREMFEF